MSEVPLIRVKCLKSLPKAMSKYLFTFTPVVKASHHLISHLNIRIKSETKHEGLVISFSCRVNIQRSRVVMTNDNVFRCKFNRYYGFPNISVDSSISSLYLIISLFITIACESYIEVITAAFLKQTR